METKTCTRCDAEKPIEEFRLGGVRANGKRYRASECNDCHRASSRAYRNANLAVVQEREREYGRRNAERKREVARRWYAENRERAIAATQQRTLQDPERHLAFVMASRARKRGATIVEVFTRDEIVQRDLGVCHVCAEPVPPDELHLDHVIPLKDGGPHTRENVKVSHARCNLARRYSG